jgi:hypothetical protein
LASFVQKNCGPWSIRWTIQLQPCEPLREAIT